MRFMAFCEMYCTGGGTRYTLDCLNALPDAYSEIILATNDQMFFCEDSNDVQKDIRMIEIPFFSYNRIAVFLGKTRFQKTFFCRLLMKICQILEPLFLYINVPIFLFQIYKKKPDTICAFNGGYPASLATLSFAIAGYLLKTPVILSIVSLPQKRKSIYGAFLDKMIWACCKHILVNCRAIKEDLVIKRKAPRNKIKVIYNTVQEQDILRKKKTNSLNIGFFSRIEIEKGVFVLYDSFVNLVKKISNINLIFIGTGSALEELQERVKKDGLSEKVAIKGYYYGNSASALKDFDIFVLPSFIEGLPYALLEAMSCGKAIIATRVGGIPEVITNGKDGLLISPKSVEECEKALEKLLSCPFKIDLMAKNSIDKYRKLISPLCFKKNIEEFFSNILSSLLLEESKCSEDNQ
tara:strand:- start:468 stop:1691 length:1224 start_codon:yes stop_codon:yes gene_type:complete